MSAAELIDYFKSQSVHIFISRSGKLGLHIGKNCPAHRATLRPLLRAHDVKVVAWLIAKTLSSKRLEDDESDGAVDYEELPF